MHITTLYIYIYIYIYIYLCACVRVYVCVCRTGEMMQEVEDRRSTQRRTCPRHSVQHKSHMDWSAIKPRPPRCGVKQACSSRLRSHCSCCIRVLQLFLLNSPQPNLSITLYAQTVATTLAEFPVLCSSVVTVTFMFAGTTQPRVRERTAPVWISPDAAAKSGRQASLRHFLAVLALG